MNYPILSFKEPPCNLFAEKFVLGTILNNPETISIVSERLNVEAFFFYPHQILYKSMLIVYGEGKKIDIVNLSSWLIDHKSKEYIKHILELSNFFNHNFVFNTLEDYIALIYEKYVRRCLIRFGEEVIQLSFDNTCSIETVLSTIQKKFLFVVEKKKAPKLNSTAEILTQVVGEIKQNLDGSNRLALTTFFNTLDSLTQGFHQSDLIILAGRPSMGKTAFCLNLAKDISVKHNICILFFSLEMTRHQLIYRLLATEAKIDSVRLRSGFISKDEWQSINKSVNTLSKLKLYIDDTVNINIDDIKLKVIKLEQEYQNKFHFIVIDYLQLLESSKKIENRTQELSQITRSLKKLARDLNVPILVLSQLSRSVETRTNKRPLLSDLRESGCFAFTKKIKSHKKFKEKKTTLCWTGKKIIKKDVFSFKSTGQKPLYRLFTSIGRSILTSGNHKVYTKEGWRRIDELKENTLICMKLVLCNFFFSTSQKVALNWEKIIRITFVKPSLVYDLEIPFFSNYLSNRLILHNSIEQDADVVMMLYRDEYYNSNTNDTNMVEVILVKHRHGALGTAKLKFDPQYLYFSDFKY